METDNLTTDFATGRIILEEKETGAQSLAWNEHATFRGVYLKHLITGKDTQGRFSLHLVRIEQDCAIGDHVHASQYEMHEIVEGIGEGKLGGKTVAYLPGVCAVIPEGVHHGVVATQSDLVLLATFIPPLL